MKTPKSPVHFWLDSTSKYGSRSANLRRTIKRTVRRSTKALDLKMAFRDSQ